MVRVVRSDLEGLFRIPDARIHVLGLNPHAGEAGGIGREEADVIAPAIEALKARGYRIAGPFPADSYFRPGFEQGCDAIVAWYHDQGLLPVKCLAFGEAVNVTLGLPIVRTSVDHGTAFDRAWRGDADPGLDDVRPPTCSGVAPVVGQFGAVRRSGMQCGAGAQALACSGRRPGCVVRVDLPRSYAKRQSVSAGV